MFRLQPENSSGPANYDRMVQSIQRLNVPARPWNRGANFVGRFDDPHYSPAPDLRQPPRQWELEDRGEKFPEEYQQGGYPMVPEIWPLRPSVPSYSDQAHHTINYGDPRSVISTDNEFDGTSMPRGNITGHSWDPAYCQPRQPVTCRCSLPRTSITQRQVRTLDFHWESGSGHRYTGGRDGIGKSLATVSGQSMNSGDWRHSQCKLTQRDPDQGAFYLESQANPVFPDAVFPVCADSVRYSWKPLLSSGTGASGVPQMIATRTLAPKIGDSLAGSGGAGQSPPLVQAERIPEAQHSFNQYMSPIRRRKRRSLTDAEKKHAKNVRKQGACPQCKSKKRKCSHVADPTDDGPSPGSQGTESGDSEAPTPESDAGMNYEVGPEQAIPDGFSWEDYLNSDLL